ncbi:MAG: ABC transporter ATP-binding protein [Deltaproteobacteria bacterium]|jgi:ABC-type multidrug transport system ATPase subunit|nr:ABC transporter ATP-binding protein [Deltaproteobacteria bacterium]
MSRPNNGDAPLLVVKNLTRAFGSRLAIQEASFTLGVGERLALVGPNGAGKTTLLKLIAGVLAADYGTIAIDGLSPALARQTAGLVGWLPESAPLNPDLTVLEHLSLSADFLGLKSPSADQKIEELIGALNLKEKLPRLCGQLSLGSRRQVALALALMGPPKLLLLDEPTSSLDPLEVLRCREYLRTLPESTSIIISSHALDEAAKSTTLALFVAAGRISGPRPWPALGPDLEASYLRETRESPRL